MELLQCEPRKRVITHKWETMRVCYHGPVNERIAQSGAASDTMAGILKSPLPGTTWCCIVPLSRGNGSLTTSFPAEYETLEA
jgi:hypothetical protein